MRHVKCRTPQAVVPVQRFNGDVQMARMITWAALALVRDVVPGFDNLSTQLRIGPQKGRRQLRRRQSQILRSLSLGILSAALAAARNI
ncbi:hypothetical protein CMUS01_03823 [Colletotrichum musicola]|uniref:Uncharacterized protein n=1 Tax=Colletotrichum musicola TaxID=2175873 RepID=A0A8H6U5C0_9PEZI|nr:hypothetical protein CMUS01_03823 [Colletotrichum musicola]